MTTSLDEMLNKEVAVYILIPSIEHIEGNIAPSTSFHSILFLMRINVQKVLVMDKTKHLFY